MHGGCGVGGIFLQYRAENVQPCGNGTKSRGVFFHHIRLGEKIFTEGCENFTVVGVKRTDFSENALTVWRLKGIGGVFRKFLKLIGKVPET